MINCENETDKKLLIIGNGFDRAHSLPTSYEHFKKYLSDLIREYDGLDKSEECIYLKDIPESTIPNIHTLNGVIADYEQERKIIYWLIDDVAKRKRKMQWNEFENYLGQLRTDKVIKKWGNDRVYGDCLRCAVGNISGFFFEWINTIDLSTTKKVEPYRSLINAKTDIALTFNYTETLEYVYGMDASNICYIHGQRETDPILREKKRMSSIGKNYSELVVGFDSKYIRNRKEAEEKILLMGLRKDTDSIIYHYKDFFDRIAYSGIKEIYSLGFSFAEVDMPYIKKICEMLCQDECDRNMTWFIAPYGNALQRVRQEVYFWKCIRCAGFRGKIRKLKSNT